MSDKLTGKQAAFVRYYIVNGYNATDAARQAGYKGDDNTLAVTGSRLLRSAKVKAEIAQHFNELEMSVEEVRGRLSKQARADILSVIEITKYGDYIIDLHKAKELGVTHLIKSLRPTKYGTAVELYSAYDALVQLGRMHALFTDTVKVEDWRDELIGDIKAGHLTYEQVVELFDEGLADELFSQVGDYVTVTDDD